MKSFRNIVAALLGAMAITFASVGSAQVYPAVGGDVTDILGANPYFPYGISTEPNGIWTKLVTDSTPTTPATVGSILVYSPATGLWTKQTASLPGAQVQQGMYGVVTIAAKAVGGTAKIVVRGPAQTLCTTNATTAIAAGTPVQADGAGNCTTFAIPSTPPTPTLVVNGTTGSATPAYALVAVSYDGIPSAIGTAVAASTANATTTYLNSNTINWTPAADAAYYIVVRTAAAGTPSTTGVIGIVPGGQGTFTDIGNAILANTSATQFFTRPAAGGTPTVAQVSGATAGSTTDSYKVTAIMPNGVWGAEGSAGSLTTANAVLSATNGNKITWTATTGAVLYAIDRTAAGGTPSSTGLIGYATPAMATSGFLDIGQAAVTFPTAQTVPNPTPRAGACLGYALGALTTSTSTPTLTNVLVGCF